MPERFYCGGLMDRIWSSLGCFFLTLLALLFAIGVTESIKYSSMPIKFLVLGAAALGAGAIAYMRDQIKFRRRPVPERLGPKDEKARQRPLDDLGQPSLSQRSKGDFSGHLPSDASQSLPPGSGPTANETILASRRQAILFRQIVPPNHDPAHLSFFGGLPIAPSGFQWPRGETKPYTFIMQLDCSAVPSEGRLGMFPDQGVMYLFLDLEWGEGNPFRVIYEPGPSQGWAEIASPSDLPHAFDSKLAWRWPQSDNEWPRLLPKWPFDPVLIQGGPLPDKQEALDETYAWAGTINTNEAIPEIEGAVVEYRGWYKGGTPNRDRPFFNFPQDWNAVRITTGLVAKSMKREVTAARTRHFRELSDEEFAAKVTEAQDSLSAWSNRVSTARPFDSVPKTESDEFWSWILDHEWLTRLVITDASNLSVEASLTAGPDAAARIPLEVVDHIRSRHALATHTERGLHIRIPDRMLAAPVDVQGDIEERAREFLLLLELSSDEGLAHYFGEGVYQFWIRPADLAARRFDRVELTTTAY
jgi:hypothetical protein